MEFNWDKTKAARNKRIHGVSFEEAIDVFGDPNHVVSENYDVDGEQRYDVIGLAGSVRLLLVVFVDRSDGDTLNLRIISARKATAYEQTIYNETAR